LVHLVHINIFAEKRFRFLVEWDPNALLHPQKNNSYLPIHHAAYNPTIRGFQLVFKYGIRYFPKKRGISLIFKKTHDGWTPFLISMKKDAHISEGDIDRTAFQTACKRFGHEEVMKIIEDTPARCYTSSDNTPTLNIEEALILAAIDKHIHLDCVYFLLRREPGVLQKLLSSTTVTMNNNNTNKDNNNGNRNENDYLSKVIKINPKKRKRKDKKNEDDDD
jgi:hypothetical protein